MHREHLISLLIAYKDQHLEEQACSERFLTFVRNHEDCFLRSLLTGHVTGSAWVVNRAGTHALMTHHRKLDRWLQLGGHADGEPDIQAVAMREVGEESGLEEVRPLAAGIYDLDIHTIPGRKQVPEHLHYDVRFLFEANSDEPLIVNRESKALAWVRFDQIPDKVGDDSVLRMLNKWRLRSS